MILQLPRYADRLLKEKADKLVTELLRIKDPNA